MRRITKRLYDANGNQYRIPKDMKRLLNLNILKLLNKAERAGSYDLPALHCSTDLFPDFLALYTEPGLYHKTALTAVCFYDYDRQFDGINGLYNAIYYNDTNLLKQYRDRFQGVHFFISPDYSVFGDIHHIENLIRVWKSRIVALWLCLELNAIVIPNFMYSSAESLDEYSKGLEDCQVIAISAKGHIRNPFEKLLTESAIKYAVDNMPLKAIVVYSVCGNDENAYQLFRYASSHNVQVIIPENTLRSRNRKVVLK